MGMMEERIQIKLSPLAMSVLDQEMAMEVKRTGRYNRSGIINDVFMAYYMRAGVNILARIRDQAAAYANALNEDAEDVPKNPTLKKLLAAKKKELIEEAKRRSSQPGEQIRFRMQDRMLLVMDGPEGEEIRQETGLPNRRIIRAVIEEFYTLPNVERERILCSENARILERLCLFSHREDPEKGTIVNILYGDDDKVEHMPMLMWILPCALDTDAYHQYLYLYAVQIQTNPVNHQEEAIAVNLRLRRIRRVDENSAVSGRITKYENEIEQVQRPMSGEGTREVKSYRVRMTPAGQSLFNKIQFGRPRFRGVEDAPEPGVKIYHFTDFPFNIQVYFERFGKEAVVLKDGEDQDDPDNLHDRIQSYYEEAAEAYRSTDPE